MAVEIVIRSQRSGADLELSQLERKELFNVTHSAGWEVLLRLMESTCIKYETQAINAQEDAEVLRTHRYAKVSWQIFVELQQKVYHEIQEGLALGAEAPSGEDL